MLSDLHALLYAILAARQVGFNTDSAGQRNEGQRLKNWLKVTEFVDRRAGSES